jgi:hypothetical protein
MLCKPARLIAVPSVFTDGLHSFGSFKSDIF